MKISLKAKEARMMFLEKMGRSQEDFEKDIDTIEEWLKSQKHLPEITSRTRIAAFLVFSKCSIEIAKKLIDMYYSIKNILPEIYENAHPRLPHIQAVRKALYYVMLPTPTKEGKRVKIFKVNDHEMYQKMDYYHFVSYTVWLQEISIAEDECSGDIYVCDIGDFVLSDVLRFTPMLLKKISFLSQELFSNGIYAIYFLNCPVLEAFLKIIKMFLHPKLVARIMVFKNLESLHERIPREIFPKEYGGNEFTLDELNDSWAQKITEYYDRYDEYLKLQVKEELRAKPLKNDEMLGFYGNFKKLNVD